MKQYSYSEKIAAIIFHEILILPTELDINIFLSILSTNLSDIENETNRTLPLYFATNYIISS